LRTARPAFLGLILFLLLAAAPAQEVSGPELARRLGCWACHSLPGQGDQKGSSLANIGARLSPEDLHAILTHPRSRLPKAKMPSYAHLRPGEMRALIDYLRSLEK
jgi:cbb3-type cytochrome oxidase cytochrome c subunit